MKIASKWLENAISKVRNHDFEIAKHETAILETLLEIESRKAYSAQGFDGLYSFCIKTFGWSESQTSTRTQAMYAMRAVPEIKEKIDSGAMSLTTVAQVQRLIRQEQTDAGIKRSAEEKLQVFESFQNKTAAEVKVEIAARKGERIKLKLALELDEEAEEMWSQVRNLSAHQTQGSALNCLKVLMKTYLEKTTRHAPARQKPPISQPTATQPAKGSTTEETPLHSPADLSPPKRVRPSPAQRTTSSSTKVTNSISRFIPAEIRRQVYARDHHQCRLCGSKHALQIDHIQPIAKGGTSELSNLRLLCRSCNLNKAIRDFGKRAQSRIAS